MAAPTKHVVALMSANATMAARVWIAAHCYVDSVGCRSRRAATSESPNLVVSLGITSHPRITPCSRTALLSGIAAISDEKMDTESRRCGFGCDRARTDKPGSTRTTTDNEPVSSISRLRMPPARRPLDPDRPTDSFALSLRELHRAAGRPKYRVLAAAINASSATVSAILNGHRFPSWEQTQAFVEGCGGDSSEWKQRWMRADRSRGVDGAGFSGRAALADATLKPLSDSATTSPSSTTPSPSSPSPLEPLNS